MPNGSLYPQPDPYSIYGLRQQFSSPYQLPGQLPVGRSREAMFGGPIPGGMMQGQPGSPPGQQGFFEKGGVQAGLQVGQAIGDMPLRGPSYSTFGEQSAVGRGLEGISGAIPAVSPVTAALKAGTQFAAGTADTIKYLTSEMEDVDLGGITPYYQKPNIDVEGLEQMQENMPTAFGAGLRTFAKNPFLAFAAGVKAKEQREEFGQDIERARQTQAIGERKFKEFQEQQERRLMQQQELARRSGIPRSGANIYNIGYSNYI